MKKVMDKLLNTIKFDKKYVLFSIIIVVLGLITGSLFIVILNKTDKTLVIEYIQKFIEDIKNNNFNFIDTLKNTIIINYLLVIIITILGFTFFLSFSNILILFYKAFVIGFSLSSFILTYKIKGILLSIVYIFPHLIINILLISILTAYMLKLSHNMIKYIINKKELNMRTYFNKYLYILILFIILFTITSLYESFVVPHILKWLTNLLI